MSDGDGRTIDMLSETRKNQLKLQGEAQSRRYAGMRDLGSRIGVTTNEFIDLLIAACAADGALLDRIAAQKGPRS